MFESWAGSIWQYSCILLYSLVLSCIILYYLVLSCIILYYLVLLSCICSFCSMFFLRNPGATLCQSCHQILLLGSNHRDEFGTNLRAGPAASNTEVVCCLLFAHVGHVGHVIYVIVIYNVIYSIVDYVVLSLQLSYAKVTLFLRWCVLCHFDRSFQCQSCVLRTHPAAGAFSLRTDYPDDPSNIADDVSISMIFYDILWYFIWLSKLSSFKMFPTMSSLWY